MPRLPWPTHSERLTRLETQIDHLIKLAERNHEDLHEHLNLMRTWREETQARLAHSERTVGTLATHMTWMKGIWAAVQASVVAWLGFK